MGKLLPLHPIINNILAIQITYRRTSRLSMRIVKNGDVTRQSDSIYRGAPRLDQRRQEEDLGASATAQRILRQIAPDHPRSGRRRIATVESANRTDGRAPCKGDGCKAEQGVFQAYHLALGAVQRARPQHLYFGLRTAIARMVCRTCCGARDVPPLRTKS